MSYTTVVMNTQEILITLRNEADTDINLEHFGRCFLFRVPEYMTLKFAYIGICRFRAGEAGKGSRL